MDERQLPLAVQRFGDRAGLRLTMPSPLLEKSVQSAG